MAWLPIPRKITPFPPTTHALTLPSHFLALPSSDAQYHSFKALVKDLASESEEAQFEVLDSLLQVLMLPSALYNSKYWKLLFDVYALISPTKAPRAEGEPPVDLGHQLAHQAFHPRSGPLWRRYLSSITNDSQKLSDALEALLSIPIRSEPIFQAALTAAELNASETEDTILAIRKPLLEQKLEALKERNEADCATWTKLLSELTAVFSSYPPPQMTAEGEETGLSRLTSGEIRIEVSEASNKAIQSILLLRDRAVDLWSARTDEASRKSARAFGFDPGFYVLHRSLGEAFERKFFVLARQLALTLVPLLAESYRSSLPLESESSASAPLEESMLAKPLSDIRIVLEAELAPYETHSEDNALIVALVISENYGPDFGSMETKDQAAASARGFLFEFMTTVSRSTRALPSPDIARYVARLGLLSAKAGTSDEKEITDGDFFIGLCQQEWHQVIQASRSSESQVSEANKELILEFIRLYEVHLDFHCQFVLRDESTPERKAASLQRLSELVGSISSASELIPFAQSLVKSIISKLEPIVDSDLESGSQVENQWKSLLKASQLIINPSEDPKRGEEASGYDPNQDSSAGPSQPSTETFEPESSSNTKKRSRDESMSSTDINDDALEPGPSKVPKLDEIGEKSVESSGHEPEAAGGSTNPPSAEPFKHTSTWAPRPPHQPGLPQHDESFRLSAALVNALIPSQRALTDVSLARSEPSPSEPSELDASTELERLEQAQRALLQKKKQGSESAAMEVSFSPFLTTNLNAAQRTKLSQLLQKDELFGLVKQLEESQTKAEMELEREKTVLQSMHAQRRVDLTKQHQARSHNTPITSDAHLQAIVSQNAAELAQLESELSLEMTASAAKRADVMDEKLRNQQQVLHAFAVPGFTATKDEQALKLQRAILELIVAQSAKRPKPQAVASKVPAKTLLSGLGAATLGGAGEKTSTQPGSVAITYENSTARHSMLEHHLELLKAQHTASKAQVRPPAFTSPIRPVRSYPFTSPVRVPPFYTGAPVGVGAPFSRYPNPAGASGVHPAVPNYQTRPYAPSVPPAQPQAPLAPSQAPRPYGNPIEQQYARLEALKQRILSQRANAHQAPPQAYGSYAPPPQTVPSQAEVLQDLNRQLAAAEQRDRFATQTPPAQTLPHAHHHHPHHTAGHHVATTTPPSVAPYYPAQHQHHQHVQQHSQHPHSLQHAPQHHQTQAMPSSAPSPYYAQQQNPQGYHSAAPSYATAPQSYAAPPQLAAPQAHYYGTQQAYQHPHPQAPQQTHYQQPTYASTAQSLHQRAPHFAPQAAPYNNPSATTPYMASQLPYAAPPQVSQFYPTPAQNGYQHPQQATQQQQQTQNPTYQQAPPYGQYNPQNPYSQPPHYPPHY